MIIAGTASRSTNRVLSRERGAGGSISTRGGLGICSLPGERRPATARHAQVRRGAGDVAEHGRPESGGAARERGRAAALPAMWAPRPPASAIANSHGTTTGRDRISSTSPNQAATRVCHESAATTSATITTASGPTWNGMPRSAASSSSPATGAATTAPGTGSDMGARAPAPSPPATAAPGYPGRRTQSHTPRRTAPLEAARGHSVRAEPRVRGWWAIIAR